MKHRFECEEQEANEADTGKPNSKRDAKLCPVRVREEER